MVEFRVEFLKTEYKTGQAHKVKMTGLVKDRYMGVTMVTQDAPSSHGGVVALKEFHINADFYLILGDDQLTYSIRCDAVKISW